MGSRPSQQARPNLAPVRFLQQRGVGAPAEEADRGWDPESGAPQMSRRDGPKWNDPCVKCGLYLFFTKTAVPRAGGYRHGTCQNIQKPVQASVFGSPADAKQCVRCELFYPWKSFWISRKPVSSSPRAISGIMRKQCFNCRRMTRNTQQSKALTTPA